MDRVWMGGLLMALLLGCRTEEPSGEVLGAERANPTPVVPHEHTDDAGNRTDRPGPQEVNECRNPERADTDVTPGLHDDTQAPDSDRCEPRESLPGGIEERAPATSVNPEPERPPAPPLPPNTPPEKMPEPLPFGTPRPRL